MHFRRLCNWFEAGWDTPSSDDLTDGMARALRPLVAWVPSANDLNGAGFQARSDLAWNLYMSAMLRTVGADAFPLVASSEDSWNEVMLQALGPPGLTPGPAQTPCTMLVGGSPGVKNHCQQEEC